MLTTPPIEQPLFRFFLCHLVIARNHLACCKGHVRSYSTSGFTHSIAFCLLEKNNTRRCGENQRAKYRPHLSLAKSNSYTLLVKNSATMIFVSKFFSFVQYTVTGRKVPTKQDVFDDTHKLKSIYRFAFQIPILLYLSCKFYTFEPCRVPPNNPTISPSIRTHSSKAPQNIYLF